MAQDSPGVKRHYGRPGLLQAILDGARAAGHDPKALAPQDLSAVDQFHVGGLDETVALAERAGLGGSEHVLDVGGGIGGAARLLASRLGCQVTVVDLTPEFCEAGEELTRRCGLAGRVQFRCSSALDLPFADQAFDAGWTQHSSMNIEDKPRLYRELHRVLRPGGRLAIHEIVEGPAPGLHMPVPWARDSAISFLLPPEALRGHVLAAGFRELAWEDITARSLAWLARRLGSTRGLSSPPPLGLHLLLGADTPTLMGNLLRNLEDDHIHIVQGVFERP